MKETRYKLSPLVLAFHCAVLLALVFFISHILLFSAIQFSMPLPFMQKTRPNEGVYFVEYLCSAVVFPCVALWRYLRTKERFFLIQSVKKPAEKIGITLDIIVRLYWGVLWRMSITGILPSVLFVPIESAYRPQLNETFLPGLPFLFLPKTILLFVSTLLAFWWLFVAPHGKYSFRFLSNTASCDKHECA